MKVPFARIAYLLVFLCAASYAFVTLRGPKGVPALFEKQRQIRAIEQQNADLAREIERKRAHIKRLESSPAQQELEIRDRLKLLHPGEKVFITGEPEQK